MKQFWSGSWKFFVERRNQSSGTMLTQGPKLVSRLGGNKIMVPGVISRFSISGTKQISRKPTPAIALI